MIAREANGSIYRNHACFYIKYGTPNPEAHYTWSLRFFLSASGVPGAINAISIERGKEKDREKERREEKRKTEDEETQPGWLTLAIRDWNCVSETHIL